MKDRKTSRGSADTDRNLAMARRIAGAVRDAGGRAFFVGGYVRDVLLGLENKDIDIEIHGVPVRTLEALLDGLGQRTAMGESFGVMGLKHYQIDIAMPRSEVATGRGHRDFEVFVDPFIGYEKAARRRDFTMNAMMMDVLTGEVLDYFGGREDMRQGLIRHVNDLTFVEDPLRVFRAAQFAARFGFAVAPETARLSEGMAVDALARERVLGELEKALLKAGRPSVFFRELRGMKQLGIWFAELDGLEGEDWQRFAGTLDAAAALRGRTDRPMYFMLAALCVSLDAEPAGRLLTRLTNEVEALRWALNLRQTQREAEAALNEGADIDRWMAVYDACVCPEALISLTLAAFIGQGRPSPEARMREALEVYTQRMRAPGVLGRDLLAAGARPGPRMGEALKLAHDLQLRGEPREIQLARALEWIKNVR